MKKNIIITILAFTSFYGCSFIEDYSQDLVIVSNPTQANEVLLGDGYIEKKQVEKFWTNQIAPFLNYMDDDIQVVAGHDGNNSQENDATLCPATYGYTTWQAEVGRSYDKSSLSADDQTWNALYRKINIMNILLDELDNMGVSKESDKLLVTRMRGEIHFLRAEYYFTLINLYAKAYNPTTAYSELGVPLKLSNAVQTGHFTRNSVGEIYDQIVKDLQESIDYFIESPQTKTLYRANIYASRLLLSRVYLYMQDYTNAKNMAAEYLKDKFDITVFGSTTSQSVFLNEECTEIVFSNGCLTSQNNLYAVPGDFCVSNDLISIFDTINDYRYESFFVRSVTTDSMALGNKYRRDLHISYVSDMYTLRNSEAYLNLAEAEFMLGNEAESRNALGMLMRNRYRVYNAPTASGADLDTLIRDERRRELCFEGHRWFDLRRYAARQQYQYSKDILRYYAKFDYRGSRNFERGEIYLLPAGDDAYVMQIPNSVTEFDYDMPTNPREAREYIDTYIQQ